MTAATDVKRPGRPRNPDLHEAMKRFAAMPIGSSFFIPDARRADIEWLRKPATAMGIGVEIAEVALDEIYQQPGVRVFRRAGPWDDEL